jgi:Putative transposase/Transposase zinc-binding domain
VSGARPAFEVADIFRQHGDAFRAVHAGHLSQSQLRVMGAIEACRTAALGGHVERCVECGHQRISYNSCRDRHCPKCQSTAAREWLSARTADLLPVEYFHVVFTLPAPVAAIAYHNKATVYSMLFEAAAETLKTIAADERHLGAEIGAIMVLHPWGQTLTHHPHVHCIVPGGGLSAHGVSWIACRQGFFLPVRVLSRLYRRLFLEKLRAAYRADKLRFFGDLTHLSDRSAFDAVLTSLHRTEWLVHTKRPFAGPEQVLAYLARYTHPVAISSHRLLAVDDSGVTFSWRDYRDGARMKSMTLAANEFIRRFLLHVLPDGLQRIRHYGSLANGHRRAKLALIRRLLTATPHPIADEVTEQQPACAAADAPERPPCPCCGSRMVVIEILPELRRGNCRPDTS